MPNAIAQCVIQNIFCLYRLGVVYAQEDEVIEEEADVASEDEALEDAAAEETVSFMEIFGFMIANILLLDWYT